MSHYLKLNRTATQGPQCGVPHKDVAFPPRVPAVMAADYLARGAAPPASRRLQFFFAGNVPDAGLVPSQPDRQLMEEGYSEGVRQLVWKYLRGVPNFRVVSRSSSYLTDWAESAVCLAPTGVGWGVRLMWAIGAGCIPLLADTEVSGWFDDVLPYDQFAIRGFPKAELRNLPQYLARVSPSELLQKHQALLSYRHFFLWPPVGMAYNITMYQLCLRSRRIDEGMQCSSLLPAQRAALARR